jgi:ribosomal protein S18 acetylase RimI-like enzyme
VKPRERAPLRLVRRAEEPGVAPVAPPPDPLVLRPGTAADADEITDVFLRSRRHAGALMPRMTHSAGETRMWLATIVLAEQEVWVGDLAGRIVAMLVLRDESLDHLYVRPEHQRRGIGARLLGQAKRRRHHLRLSVFESNAPARAFYEKHGFRAVAYGDGTGNEEGAPDVLYEWGAKN